MSCVTLLMISILAQKPTGKSAEPASPYRLVTPKDEGIIATGINGGGDLVGFEWVERKDKPGIVDQVPFFARGKKIITLPLLTGYTATFPAAISDTGLVVGRASKPGSLTKHVHLRNQAVIWDEAKGIRGLGTLKDDSASLACGVTRDGTCICGFSVGDNRVRACIWEREGETWNATPLPQEGQLGSQVVVMSNDGCHVASIDSVVPCHWSRRDRKSPWIREVIGDPGSFAPRAVNNEGVVVGVHFTSDGLSEAVSWTRETKLVRFAKPQGYVKAEANAINNHGIIVGMVDGPSGSEIGPNAFLYENGRLRIITEFGPTFTIATAINDAGQVAGVIDKEEPEEAGAKADKQRRP